MSEFLFVRHARFGLLALIGCWSLHGQAQSASQKVNDNPLPAQCAQYQKIPAPSSDQPTAQQKNLLAKCDSQSLYYGIGKTADPVSARQCAYIERAGGENAGHPLSGAAILSMIYANGEGVPRNYALALKFACEAGGAPAESEGRVQHLEDLQTKEHLQQTSQAATNFDFCDDSTSGYMQGFCAAKDDRITQARRDRRLNAIMSRWTAKQKTAFAPLEKAADTFFTEHARSEVDQSGTGRAAFVLDEETKVRNAFVAAISKFEKGDLPRSSAVQFRAADSALNATYSNALKATASTDPNSTARAFGTVNADDIRNTQRLWLRYRDAWVAFGAVKYPSVSADSWRTWATLARTRQLVRFTGAHKPGA